MNKMKQQEQAKQTKKREEVLTNSNDSPHRVTFNSRG